MTPFPAFARFGQADWLITYLTICRRTSHASTISTFSRTVLVILFTWQSWPSKASTAILVARKKLNVGLIDRFGT